MSISESVWIDVLDWLKAMDSRLPAVFPPELPPETSPDFWFRVAQIEMSTRDALSAKVRSLVRGEGLSAMTPLEAWLYRRRVEWAAQVAFVKAKERVEPDVSLAQVLDWLLIGTWESDGCIGLWNHAERGGRAHPQNPGGLTPIEKNWQSQWSCTKLLPRLSQGRLPSRADR